MKVQILTVTTRRHHLIQLFDPSSWYLIWGSMNKFFSRMEYMCWWDKEWQREERKWKLFVCNMACKQKLHRIGPRLLHFPSYFGWTIDSSMRSCTWFKHQDHYISWWQAWWMLNGRPCRLAVRKIEIYLPRQHFLKFTVKHGSNSISCRRQ